MDENNDNVFAPSSAKSKNASTPAERALREAAERRRVENPSTSDKIEIAGRGGLDPVRYGDWEAKGLASDF